MPQKIAGDLVKIPGGKLEHLEQILSLALGPNLKRIWIKIQIHSEGFEFE
jgi:hypothetical protein